MLSANGASSIVILYAWLLDLMSRSGGTGRRACLRGMFLREWGFKSPLRHRKNDPVLAVQRKQPERLVFELLALRFARL